MEVGWASFLGLDARTVTAGGLGRQLHNAPLEVAMFWGASLLMAAVFIVIFILFLVTSAWIFWLVRKSTRSNVAR